MKVTFSRRGKRDLINLPKEGKKRIIKALERFETGGVLDLQRLKTKKNVWRIRVGVWRVILNVNWSEGQAEVLHILDRKDAYRG